MATLKELIRKALQMTTPTGTMMAFAGKSVPEGWLLCNGANVSRTTYSKLFAVIGTTWGTGDGSTTFTLPNCEGRFLEGTTSTSNVGTYLEAGLPNITGTTDVVAGTKSGYLAYLRREGSGALSPYMAGSGTVPSLHVDYWDDGYMTHAKLDASISSSLYKSTSILRPKSAYTLMIIKV